MLLSEPPPTQGDLHFRIAGVPVRVHPFFWLVTLIMGLGGGGETPPAALAVWMAVVFISVLVHELGHALVQRKFGGRPWITLHGVGGLSSCDDCDRRPSSQILISLAGPAAGFILAAVVFAAIKLTGRQTGLTLGDATTQGVVPLRLLGVTAYFEPFQSYTANLLILNMLWVNIAWGLINLLPVYPLDGGRVAREVLTLRHPRRGIVWSYKVSVIVAGAMALYGLFAWQSWFTGLMFGYLSYTSYQSLQAYQQNYW